MCLLPRMPTDDSPLSAPHNILTLVPPERMWELARHTTGPKHRFIGLSFHSIKGSYSSHRGCRDRLTAYPPHLSPLFIPLIYQILTTQPSAMPSDPTTDCTVPDCIHPTDHSIDLEDLALDGQPIPRGWKAGMEAINAWHEAQTAAESCVEHALSHMTPLAAQAVKVSFLNSVLTPDLGDPMTCTLSDYTDGAAQRLFGMRCELEEDDKTFLDEIVGAFKEVYEETKVSVEAQLRREMSGRVGMETSEQANAGARVNFEVEVKERMSKLEGLKSAEFDDFMRQSPEYQSILAGVPERFRGAIETVLRTSNTGPGRQYRSSKAFANSYKTACDAAADLCHRLWGPDAAKIGDYRDALKTVNQWRDSLPGGEKGYDEASRQLDWRCREADKVAWLSSVTSDLPPSDEVRSMRKYFDFLGPTIFDLSQRTTAFVSDPLFKLDRVVTELYEVEEDTLRRELEVEVRNSMEPASDSDNTDEELERTNKVRERVESEMRKLEGEFPPISEFAATLERSSLRLGVAIQAALAASNDGGRPLTDAFDECVRVGVKQVDEV